MNPAILIYANEVLVIGRVVYHSVLAVRRNTFTNTKEDRLTYTSQNNPLRIDTVRLPREMGTIGMTLCPGKICQGLSASHHRDLAADLEVIRAWGAEILVSLIEEHEYSQVGIVEMDAMIPKGITHIKVPIKDVNVPDARWERDWVKHGPSIRAVVLRGGRVCIHCMGGLGRTGLVAARLLVEFGFSPEAAMQMVRLARPGAIETEAQEQYVASLDKIWLSFDRARACLLAGACGDALGATVEFSSRESILAAFGPLGIKDFTDNDYGTAGKITDDTQMTLFTAEGLIRAEVQSRREGISNYEGHLHHAYLRWLHTQGCKVPVDGYVPDGWLIGQQELHHRRAPGGTCLGALSRAKGLGNPLHADNMSKGCGGVMRAAPVGLFMAAKRIPKEESRRLAFDIGCASARLTHGHPSGYLSAGAFALIIHELILGQGLAQSVKQAIISLEGVEGSEETIAKLQEAMRLAREERSPESCIGNIGEGWVGEEALAIGVFCALRAKDIEEGICMAVNITGDSDSTGSIAGNILGAMHGCDSIPNRWLDNLELKDTIRNMAEDLIFIHDSPPSSEIFNPEKSDYWTKRYAGNVCDMVFLKQTTREAISLISNIGMLNT
jgi:ADP-ribosylglycohydrolase